MKLTSRIPNDETYFSTCGFNKLRINLKLEKKLYKARKPSLAHITGIKKTLTLVGFGLGS